MIFVVETEERCLYVFSQVDDAIAHCEGLDVEAAVWLFWDDAGQPLAPEFTVPNKRGTFIVANGKYHLVAAPPNHHADLLEALEYVQRVVGTTPLDTVEGVEHYLQSRVKAITDGSPT